MVEEHPLVTPGTPLCSAASRKRIPGVQAALWKAAPMGFSVLTHYSVVRKEYKSERPENKLGMTVTLLLSLKSLSSCNLNQTFSELF